MKNTTLGLLGDHYRIAAVHAHLLDLAGHTDEAHAHYLLAARTTLNVAERRYLDARAVGVASRRGFADSIGDMMRFLVVYETPRDPAAFDLHYREVHIPLAKKLPGLRRYTISRNAVASRATSSPSLHRTEFAA